MKIGRRLKELIWLLLRQNATEATKQAVTAGRKGAPRLRRAPFLYPPDSVLLCRVLSCSASLVAWRRRLACISLRRSSIFASLRRTPRKACTGCRGSPASLVALLRFCASNAVRSAATRLSTRITKTPSLVLTGWLIAPTGSVNAAPTGSLNCPRPVTVDARANGVVCTDLPAALAAVSSVSSRRPPRPWPARSCPRRLADRDAVAHLILHTSAAARPLAQRVQAGEDVAVLVIKQVARLTEVGATERPRADARRRLAEVLRPADLPGPRSGSRAGPLLRRRVELGRFLRARADARQFSGRRPSSAPRVTGADRDEDVVERERVALARVHPDDVTAELVRTGADSSPAGAVGCSSKSGMNRPRRPSRGRRPGPDAHTADSRRATSSNFAPLTTSSRIASARATRRRCRRRRDERDLDHRQARAAGPGNSLC